MSIWELEYEIKTAASQDFFPQVSIDDFQNITDLVRSIAYLDAPSTRLMIEHCQEQFSVNLPQAFKLREVIPVEDGKQVDNKGLHAAKTSILGQVYQEMMLQHPGIAQADADCLLNHLASAVSSPNERNTFTCTISNSPTKGSKNYTYRYRITVTFEEATGVEGEAFLECTVTLNRTIPK